MTIYAFALIMEWFCENKWDIEGELFNMDVTAITYTNINIK